jgi:cytoskeletal protein CcmA (bactofilin family)
MAQAKRAVSRETAVLGEGVRIRGRITGEGSLSILGTVEGDVVVRGDLSVGEHARLDSETLEAQAVTIAGEVNADINASGPVRLGPTARVRGDLKGSEVSIDEGAQFAGRIEADFELPGELGGKSGRR